MKPAIYSIAPLTLLLVMSASVVAQQPATAPQPATAQQPATPQQPAASVSTVSGRVICGDSNLPARFGRVLLKSIVPGGAGDDFTRRLQENMKTLAAKSGGPAPKPLTDEQKRTQAAAARNMNHAMDLLNASTIGMNGDYSFAHVKPGTYYVHVLYPGYIDPLAQFTDDDLASTDPAVLARVAASVPMITVSGTDSAHQDLRLDRGASVSGRVLFDDASPASGWTVTVVSPGADTEETMTPVMMQAMTLSGAMKAATTDDLGNYRISGLPSGTYVVRAALNATDIGVSASNIGESGSGINLTVYSNDAFHRTDAKSFTVVAGDNRTGVDVSVPARKLHSIVGHVYAKSDAHAVNEGSVTLTSKDNPAIHAKAAIRDDGSFHYEYLPPGNYDIKVEAAADVHTTGSMNMMGLTIPKQDTLKKYGSESASVVLGESDENTVHITVAETDWKPPVKKPGADADAGKALGGLLGGLLSDDDDKPAPKSSRLT